VIEKRGRVKGGIEKREKGLGKGIVGYGRVGEC
jgi:hypothetical protein